MIGSLLWKEWREQRWKAAGIFMVLAALLITANLLGWFFHTPDEIAQLWILVICFLVPGFVTMDTITQEQARRTDQTLRVLPVGQLQMFVCRLAGGIATMWLPLLAVHGLWFLAFRHSSGVPALRVLFAEMGLMVSLYLWVLALAARLRSEAIIALTGIIVLLGSVLVMRLGIMALDACHCDSEITEQVLFELLPVGFAGVAADGLRGPHLVAEFRGIFECTIIQGIEILPLTMLAYWQMTRTRRPSAVRAAAPPDRIPLRVTLGTMAGQRFPVVWKTWRELRWFVLGYLGVTLAFVAVDGILSWYAATVYQTSPVLQSLYREGILSGALLVGLPGVMSFLIAIVLGVEIGMRDFDSHLESFWRSRPISLGKYFNTRYAVGLTCALAVAAIPALVVYGAATGGQPVLLSISRADNFRGFPHDAMDTLVQTQSMTLAFCYFFLPQVALVFTASTLFATLTRRPVISLVLGVGFALGLQMLFIASPRLEQWRTTIESQPDRAVAYASIVLAGTSALAWLAMISVTRGWRAWFETGHAPFSKAQTVAGQEGGGA